jgi:hypothetical protein
MNNAQVSKIICLRNGRTLIKIVPEQALEVCITKYVIMVMRLVLIFIAYKMVELFISTLGTKSVEASHP